MNDASVEGTTLTNLGWSYGELQKKQDALDRFRRRMTTSSWTLPQYRVVGDTNGETTTLISIGKVYSDLGNKQQAFDYYQQALLLSRTAGDRNGEAVTFDHLGFLLRQFKSEVQQVLMMTARILHSECDSQAIFLVDY